MPRRGRAKSRRNSKPKSSTSAANAYPLTDAERSDFQSQWANQRLHRERNAGKDARLDREFSEIAKSAAIEQLVGERRRSKYWENPPTPDERLATLLDCLRWYDRPIDIRMKEWLSSASTSPTPEGSSAAHFANSIKRARLASLKAHYPMRGADRDDIAAWLEAVYPGISSDCPRGTLKAPSSADPIAETIKRAEVDELAQCERVQSLDRSGDEWSVMVLTDKGRAAPQDMKRFESLITCDSILRTEHCNPLSVGRIGQTAESTSQQAESVAKLIESLPDLVDDQFKRRTATPDRIRAVREASLNVMLGVNPVLQFLERRRPIETAKTLHARINILLSELNQAASADVEDWEPVKSACRGRIATQGVAAQLCGEALRGWARDIEMEESGQTTFTPTIRKKAKVNKLRGRPKNKAIRVIIDEIIEKKLYINPDWKGIHKAYLKRLGDDPPSAASLGRMVRRVLNS